MSDGIRDSIGTLVGCYVDRPNIIQPKEVRKVFDLYLKWLNRPEDGGEEESKEIKTICKLLAGQYGKGIEWTLERLDPKGSTPIFNILTFIKPINAESAFVSKGKSDE